MAIRDNLEAAYDATVADPAAAAPEPPEPAQVDGGTPAGEAPAPDTRSAEERARDEQGRFVKQEKTATPAKDATPKTSGIQAAEPSPKLGIKRPDSYKKELWPIWDKLDAGEPLTRDERKAFMEYLPQRESEYLKGVSTYKAEADNAKALNEAIAAHQDLLQEAQLSPAEFVSGLAGAHRTLSRGSKEEKLATFAGLIRDYRIPVHELLVQGDDGKIYFNQKYFGQQTRREQPPDVQKTVMDTINQMMAQKDLHDFINAVDAQGNKLHPHYEELRQTMNGLLQSGLAKDLKGAHDAALRLPQHAEIYATIQQAERDAEAERKRKEDEEKAARARAKAVSPRSSTSTGSAQVPGKKSIRAALEESYDQHIAGRV